MARTIQFEVFIPVNHLNVPSPSITRDASDRITQLRYDYTSIRIDYDATWDPVDPILLTYTQTITDI